MIAAELALAFGWPPSEIGRLALSDAQWWHELARQKLKAQGA